MTGLAFAAVAGGVTCRGPAITRASIQSPDPDERIKAIILIGETGDRRAIPLLVDRLEDEDAAVRMFAIEGLRRLTGQTQAWRYYESPQRRADAVARWREWLRRRQWGATSRAASGIHGS